MDNIDQGLVIMMVCMGGTLASLGLVILMVNLLKRLLPYKEERVEEDGA